MTNSDFYQFSQKQKGRQIDGDIMQKEAKSARAIIHTNADLPAEKRVAMHLKLVDFGLFSGLTVASPAKSEMPG